MFVWHNVVILYDLGYIVTALDLQCLTIDKNTTKTLQFELDTNFTLYCIEMWFVVRAASYLCFMHESKGQEKLVFAYARNGCLSWEFNPGLLRITSRYRSGITSRLNQLVKG